MFHVKHVGEIKASFEAFVNLKKFDGVESKLYDCR